MTQGNLVQNGGFEQGLAHWNVSPTHTVPQLLGNVDINEMENQSHSGMMSAELGVLSSSIPSGIWQDIPISPSSRFELVFHVTGLAARASDLTVQVLWLDDSKADIGLGLSIYIGREALGMAADGEWQSHVHRTNVSPNNARYARLVFSANGSGNSRLYIDDVVFYAVSNAALFNGGNLVQNPGFETGTLANWSSTNVTVFNTNLTHSGSFIARFNDPVIGAPAVLWQDVPVPAGRAFALIFHLSGDAVGTYDLRAEIRWLNQALKDIGQGLEIIVNGAGIGDSKEGEWSAHYQLTSPSPNDVRFARLVFSSSPNLATNRLVIDDIVLAVV